MPLAKNLMGGGLSAYQARAIGGTTNSTVTAAGTTQATAAAVTADLNIVNTATTGQGVILYAGVPNDSQIIYNSTNVDIRVYPAIGGAINQIAVNGAMVLAPKTAVWVQIISATQSIGFLSA